MEVEIKGNKICYSGKCREYEMVYKPSIDLGDHILVGVKEKRKWYVVKLNENLEEIARTEEFNRMDGLIFDEEKLYVKEMFTWRVYDTNLNKESEFGDGALRYFKLLKVFQE